jgi:hypothetical protein
MSRSIIRSRRLTAASSLLAVALAAALTGCGKAKHIEGRVLSEAGEPLQGATVSIAKSGFTATTKKDGTYSLDYAPGAMEVVYAQAGRFPDTLRVELAQKAYFPAAEMRLLKIPAEGAVVWISPKGYVPLAQATVNEIVVQKGRTIFDREIRDYAPVGEPTIVPEATPRFLDTVPAGLTLVRVNDEGRLARVSFGSFGLGAANDATAQKETKLRRSETCLQRTAELSPGDYAFVAFEGTIGQPGSPCYFFRIAEPGAAAPAATVAKTPAAASAPSYAGAWEWDGGEEGIASWVLRQNGNVVEGRYEWGGDTGFDRVATVRGEVKPDGSVALSEIEVKDAGKTSPANGRYTGKLTADGTIVGKQSFTDSDWKNDWVLTRKASGGTQ